MGASGPGHCNSRHVHQEHGTVKQNLKLEIRKCALPQQTDIPRQASAAAAHRGGDLPQGLLCQSFTRAPWPLILCLACGTQPLVGLQQACDVAPCGGDVGTECVGARRRGRRAVLCINLPLLQRYQLLVHLAPKVASCGGGLHACYLITGECLTLEAPQPPLWPHDKQPHRQLLRPRRCHQCTSGTNRTGATCHECEHRVHACRRVTTCALLPGSLHANTETLASTVQTRYMLC